MATVKELTEKYRDYSYEQLVAKAKTDQELLLPVFNEALRNNDGKFYLMIFMFGSIVSDGKLTEKEYEFTKDVFGLTREEVDNVATREKAAKSTEIADSIFDSCPDTVKTVLLDFCLCFIAVDKEIEDREIGFIAKLLA